MVLHIMCHEQNFSPKNQTQSIPSMTIFSGRKIESIVWKRKSFSFFYTDSFLHGICIQQLASWSRKITIRLLKFDFFRKNEVLNEFCILVVPRERCQKVYFMIRYTIDVVVSLQPSIWSIVEKFVWKNVQHSLFRHGFLLSPSFLIWL